MKTSISLVFFTVISTVFCSEGVFYVLIKVMFLMFDMNMFYKYVDKFSRYIDGVGYFTNCYIWSYHATACWS